MNWWVVFLCCFIYTWAVLCVLWEFVWDFWGVFFHHMSSHSVLHLYTGLVFPCGGVLWRERTQHLTCQLFRTDRPICQCFQGQCFSPCYWNTFKSLKCCFMSCVFEYRLLQEKNCTCVILQSLGSRERLIYKTYFSKMKLVQFKVGGVTNTTRCFWQIIHMRPIC